MIAIHRTTFAVPHVEFVPAEGRIVAPRTVATTDSEGRVRPVDRRTSKAALAIACASASRRPGRCRSWASDLLVPAGRSPNTHGIGLEVAGVTMGVRGHVREDAALRTARPTTVYLV